MTHDPLKTYKSQHGTIKKRSGILRTIETNLELYGGFWVVTGGYRRLPGGMDDFSDKQTLHHDIYIIIIITTTIIITIIIITWTARRDDGWRAERFLELFLLLPIFCSPVLEPHL